MGTFFLPFFFVLTALRSLFQPFWPTDSSSTALSFTLRCVALTVLFGAESLSIDVVRLSRRGLLLVDCFGLRPLGLGELAMIWETLSSGSSWR
jgi:hypothetical protein